MALFFILFKLLHISPSLPITIFTIPPPSSFSLSPSSIQHPFTFLSNIQAPPSPSSYHHLFFFFFSSLFTFTIHLFSSHHFYHPSISPFPFSTHFLIPPFPPAAGFQNSFTFSFFLNHPPLFLLLPPPFFLFFLSFFLSFYSQLPYIYIYI
jgi:hypothetical protein